MRKTKTVRVPSWGERDQGKTFVITEMPAARAEKWGWRMFVALKGVDGSIPDDVARLGMVGVAIRGLNAFLAAPVRMEEMEPLLDEMLDCITFARDPKTPDLSTPLRDGDIEEVKTRLWLRSEVLELHTGFSLSESLQTLLAALKAPQSDLPST